MGAYQAVIGLEVHARLRTRTKIFCRCPARTGGPPSDRTCPVCLGHAGALPVLNRRAVELALRAAVALDRRVRPSSGFARKHYFYPDLPRGYQIIQYDEPLATGGAVELERAGRTRRIGFERLHLEEDAARSIHETPPGGPRRTVLDFNRAGVPLIEIVTRPEIGDADEACRFVERLRAILRCTGVCDGSLEAGSLRCDANVSLRRALDHEVARQAARLEQGRPVDRETRRWDERAGVTRALRGKEAVRDYRYFPEPDLPPLRVDPSRLDRLRAELPELPAARRRRLIAEHGLAPREAERLAHDPPLADLFDEVARGSGDPRGAASWVLNDLLRELGRPGGAFAPPRAGTARRLVELMGLIARGEVSATAARREVLGEMLARGVDPAELVRRKGLGRIADERRLRELAREVLARHPRQVARYRAGKAALLAYFVGQVLRASEGRADPRRVGEILEELLRS